MPSPKDDHALPEDSRQNLEITACLRIAEELKSEGNASFRGGQWTEALVAYRTALTKIPSRKADVGTMDSNPMPNADAKTGTTRAEEQIKDPNRSPETSPDDCAKSRAVLNANIGACHLKLGDHKQAVAACSQALFDDPTYIKALQRRAACNEKIGSWSALASAQEDYTKLLKLLPPSSSAIKDTQKSLSALKPRVEAAQKEETAEMMGKLKGVGNSILGNFGLSTDNFKFVPNGQGGYSMNFSQ